MRRGARTVRRNSQSLFSRRAGCSQAGSSEVNVSQPTAPMTEFTTISQTTVRSALESLPSQTWHGVYNAPPASSPTGCAPWDWRCEVDRPVSRPRFQSQQCESVARNHSEVPTMMREIILPVTFFGLVVFSISGCSDETDAEFYPSEKGDATKRTGADTTTACKLGIWTLDPCGVVVQRPMHEGYDDVVREGIIACQRSSSAQKTRTMMDPNARAAALKDPYSQPVHSGKSEEASKEGEHRHAPHGRWVPVSAM